MDSVRECLNLFPRAYRSPHFGMRYKTAGYEGNAPRKPFGKNTLGLKFNQMNSLREGLSVSHLKSVLCEYIF